MVEQCISMRKEKRELCNAIHVAVIYPSHMHQQSAQQCVIFIRFRHHHIQKHRFRHPEACWGELFYDIALPLGEPLFLLLQAINYCLLFKVEYGSIDSSLGSAQAKNCQALWWVSTSQQKLGQARQVNMMVTKGRIRPQLHAVNVKCKSQPIS